MLYLERRPHPALAPFIKSFWYACDPYATHRHERVLPLPPSPDRHLTRPPKTPSSSPSAKPPSPPSGAAPHKAAGAEMVLDIRDMDYGGRAFTCRDLEKAISGTSAPTTHAQT